MKKQLTHTAIGLLLGTLATTSALAADAEPSPTAKAAEVPVTSLPAQERPRPVMWDRLEKGALDRHTRARRQPPVELPADIVEPAKERSADRK